MAQVVEKGFSSRVKACWQLCYWALVVGGEQTCYDELVWCFSPRDLMDCIVHIRLLSWLLVGALTHTASHSHHHHSGSHAPCQPIQQESSCHISDHIQVVMAGFAEQSKASVLHMSSLFHAFILCQVPHRPYCCTVGFLPNTDTYTHCTKGDFDLQDGAALLYRRTLGEPRRVASQEHAPPLLLD